MRLLNVKTMQLEDFVDDSVAPSYSILSHRWGEEEVLYRDLVSDDSGSRDSEGWKKILGCSQQSISSGLGYTWIDTCCIDKSSSAELSEAINSMYAWYRGADICYAFLNDILEGHDFCDSRWFDRGWTLQELLAPADVLFFDSSWKEIGFKTSMAPKISQRTGIDEKALFDGNNFSNYSIAQRMSWASDRQTTRVEDEAYCLLGIFDVNMSLIYGEGRKAFFRLQEELLRRSDDASIFAYVAAQSTFAGPTTLRISGLGIEVRVSEYVDPDMYTGGDEQQRFGTVGLFSLSPSGFRGATHYLPHNILPSQKKNSTETIMNTARHSLSFKLSGPFVEFQVPLWKVPVHIFRTMQTSMHTKEDTDLDMLDNIMKQYSIRLTVSSIQKLRKCAQAADTEELTIAFLNCRRRNAGAVGIILRETDRRGVYIRHHFPSMIETDHASFLQHGASISVDTIYVEADSVMRSAAEHPNLALFYPAWNRLAQATVPSPNFRLTNLDSFGLHQAHGGPERLYHLESSNQEFPHISFSRVGPVTASWLARHLLNVVLDQAENVHEGHGIACIVYFGDTHHSHSQYHQPSFVAAERATSHFVPIERGATVFLPLNDKYRLRVRTQLQWNREKSSLHMDSLRKGCTITLTIISNMDLDGVWSQSGQGNVKKRKRECFAAS